MKTTQDPKVNELFDIIKLDKACLQSTHSKSQAQFYYDIAKRVEDLTHNLLSHIPDTRNEANKEAS